MFCTRWFRIDSEGDRDRRYNICTGGSYFCCRTALSLGSSSTLAGIGGTVGFQVTIHPSLIGFLGVCLEGIGLSRLGVREGILKVGWEVDDGLRVSLG